jgi:hypothetical protein
MTSRITGDKPVSNQLDDALAVGPYVKALVQVILDCETPMTIAIQGDWGTGKTSFMNMVKQSLEESKSKVCVPLWFNSWLFAHFGQASQISIHLLSHFIREIGHYSDPSLMQQLGSTLEVLARAGKGFLAGTTSALVKLQTGSDELAKGTSALFTGGGESVTESIERLKIKLDELVRSANERGKVDRFVVFIDDLDRLQPSKAVEFLEMLKLFLDLEHCVFVLAIDYEVVQLGLKEKLGDAASGRPGRSFFDKMIQVPFTVPVTQYDFGKLITTLLANCGIANDPSPGIYHQLASKSVGINPRGLKRLFNTFQLLLLVAKEKETLKEMPQVKEIEVQRIIFALLCLQTAFPGAYSFLAQNASELDASLLYKLNKVDVPVDDGSKQDAGTRKFIELREGLEGNQSIGNFVEFMTEFTNILQISGLDNEGTSSSYQSDCLKKLLMFSAMTSSSSQDVVSSRNNYDRTYWLGKSSSEVMQAADELVQLVKKCEHRAEPNYKQHYIGMIVDGKPNVTVFITPQKSKLRVAVRVAQNSAEDKEIGRHFSSFRYDKVFRSYDISLPLLLAEDQVSCLETLIGKAFSTADITDKTGMNA